MKKKIKRITIMRDTDNEILVYVSRVNRNGKDLIASQNSIDAVLETIRDILYESEDSKYKLV